MTYHRWTDNDYRQLAKLVQLYGRNWRMITQYYFPDVSSVCLKNKYYTKIHKNAAYDKNSQVSDASNIQQYQSSEYIIQQLKEIMNAKMM
ncbi:Myb-like_DNA-binding domain-containing protein [Hexamita inflata]|uniref:Myb-like DNA-binding domain-containing protein n=1 Tax=Hexamita inflata TaxID=28002 RepID=A0AA86TZ05_9EUKA|nr:Myb-like DNA-binding domain-containing protein [Hexamita inflata]